MSQGSILLVEPPENDRPMYADYLRDHGYSVTEVDSTDAGLSAAQAADLVITGVRVGGSFDGIELVRRLRGDDRTKAHAAHRADRVHVRAGSGARVRRGL